MRGQNEKCVTCAKISMKKEEMEAIEQVSRAQLKLRMKDRFKTDVKNTLRER